MTRLLLAVALSFSRPALAGQDLGPASGTICGNVRDETGRPAATVRVAALYSGGTTGIQPSTITDLQGHYCVTDLMFGEWTMSANDPEKGYPEMLGAFFGPPMPGPSIGVSYKHAQAHSNFRIPYKAGFLHIVLTNARSGKSIDSMFFHLALQAHPAYTIHGSSGSTQTLLLPPGKQVTLWLTAPGYRRWPDDGSAAHPLTLRPGENLVLHIALSPAS